MVQAKIDEARLLLRAAPLERLSPWPLLGAATLAAVAAVLMAGVMILGPGVSFDAAQPQSAQVAYSGGAG